MSFDPTLLLGQFLTLLPANQMLNTLAPLTVGGGGNPHGNGDLVRPHGYVYTHGPMTDGSIHIKNTTLSSSKLLPNSEVKWKGGGNWDTAHSTKSSICVHLLADADRAMWPGLISNEGYMHAYPHRKKT